MITGAKQSFAEQTGNFAFQFDITPTNLSQPISAGLSGLNNLTFTFLNGKIYDPNNYFVGSYQNNLKTTISGEVAPNSFDYYINNNLIALGQPKSTGFFDNFYINSISGNSVSFNAYIAGTIPKYTLNNNIIFIPGQFATGDIFNRESHNSFRLFSGYSNSSNVNYSGNTTGRIAPNQSGLYYLFVPNAIQTSTYTYPITLNTNFGDITYNVTLNAGLTGTGIFTDLNFFAGNFGGISGAPLTTGNNSGPVSFLTISGLSYINTPILDIYLIGNPNPILITGTVTGSGFYSAQVSGNFYYYSGFSAFVSGNISGYGGLNNQNLYSGTGGGIISETVYYTGIVTGYYNSLYSTGLGSGYLYGFYSIVSGSGYGLYTGSKFITGGSGFLNLTGYFQSGSGYYINDPTGTGAPYTEFLTGTLNTGYYFYNTILYPTGINSGNFSVLSFGSGTTGGGLSQKASGIIRIGFNYSLQLTDSGLFTINQIYTGIVTLCSGTGGTSITPTGTFTGLYNHLYTGSGIITTGIYTTGTGFLYNVPYIFNCYSYINGSYTGNITLDDQGVLNLEFGYGITGTGNTGQIYSVYGNSGPDLVPYGPFYGTVYDYLIGSGYNLQTISGVITGALTGLLYTKTFTGDWNLKTGYNIVNLIDFKQNNYYNSGEFKNPMGAEINLTGNSIYIEVDYLSYPDYGYENVTLIITGYNTGIITNIQGGRI